MLQSVNIQLPDNIVLILDELSENGDSSEDKLSQRSTLITVALQHYSHFLQKNELRDRIRAGAIHHAERDRQISEEWFALEEEVYQETWKSIRRNHD